MIFLSLLAKTYALALGPSRFWAGVLCWVAGTVLDLLWFRTLSKNRARRRGTVARETVRFNLAALVVGLAAQNCSHYAAMRWKDGLPLISGAAGFLLQSLGLPVSSFDGTLYLTTMAGPLSFAVSLDNLGLIVPALFGSLTLVYLLLTADSFGPVWRGLGWLAPFLLGAALLRLALSIGLFLALCDFVSYESDELPLGPFVKPEMVLGLYLPFLLAGGPLLTRKFRPREPAETRPATPSPGLAWVAWPVFTLLLVVALWQPAGRLKNGTVLINTFHTQWSRTDRPYDREWYGADSGYNYACLKRWLGTFYSVRELKTRIRAQDLAEASVLILYLPDQPLTEEERVLIESFVRRGGGLLVIGDHTNVFGSASHLNEVCRPFGFFFRDDVLFDLDEDFFQIMEVPRFHSGFLHGMTFFKFRGPASIQPTSLSTRTVLALDHAKSMRAIYSVNNFYPPPHDHPRMHTGRFCVSSASRYGQGRVVAFADSTIFSNFEIFYPGKYEFLLNVAHWLNHQDAPLATFARRCALLAALILLVYLASRIRSPQNALRLLLCALLSFYFARAAGLAAEQARAEFPEPIRPAQTLFFAAEADDPSFVLKEFTSDEPYDQRYDVFVQWVLRSGAFSAFYVTDQDRTHQLYQHLRQANQAQTALALIIRNPHQLDLLQKLSSEPLWKSSRLLLMFSKQFDAETAANALQTARLIGKPDLLKKAKTAWPQGEVLLESAGHRLLLVASAERFSDQAMGFSEKVVPNETQLELYRKAFSLFDRLFDHAATPPPPTATVSP